MGSKKSWSDLSRTQRRLIMAAGGAEAVLTAAALRDLARRPASRVRGPRALWLLSFAVQPVGPLAYVALGRR